VIPTKSDHASGVTFLVPEAHVERIKAILAAVDPTAPPVDFRFACKPLVTMLAIAQGKNAPPDDQPIVPGGVSVDDCINNLFNAVPPRFIAVANDLASTYSSASKEQESLDRVNEIILTPIRLFDVIVVRPFKWTYNGVRHILSGTAGPDKRDPPDKPEFVLSASNAFILFVLQQRHHIPLPRVLPIASATAVGTIFDGRLAVAITNTYLLTLSFGFLGACVWALREINLRLENFTLAPSQFPRYRARILLGMVAGPTIGLFFNEGHLLSFTTTSTDIPSLSTQLSASAIAFIAGFSIEILFAILDRFIRIVQEFAGADSYGGNLRHSR
jgi:hypothetical protein